MKNCGEKIAQLVPRNFERKKFEWSTLEPIKLVLPHSVSLPRFRELSSEQSSRLWYNTCSSISCTAWPTIFYRKPWVLIITKTYNDPNGRLPCREKCPKSSSYHSSFTITFLDGCPDEQYPQKRVSAKVETQQVLLLPKCSATTSCLHEL